MKKFDGFFIAVFFLIGCTDYNMSEIAKEKVEEFRVMYEKGLFDNIYHELSGKMQQSTSLKVFSEFMSSEKSELGQFKKKPAD
ncbi:hypothetical protein [Buttiauxella sp.]|uniref:hypothetical protein n=1 Tax=Buttiauxella sp. TaxID=1972222 RepID=UPI003C770268